MVRGGIVVSSVIVVVTGCSDFWISVGRFLEQLRKVMVFSLFDFQESAPWQLRSSVVEFPWLATFGLLHSSLKFPEESVLSLLIMFLLD